MKHLFAYTDFRAYLKDWLTQRKEAGLPASNRWIARLMNINSASWLTSILNGSKGLSKATVNKLSTILKHSEYETRFFETLVFFNQAKSITDRNQHYNELTLLQKSRSIKTLSASQFDFYSEWFHSAIRSYIGMHGFNGNYEHLAVSISPPITPTQAKKSIKLLVKLDMITLSENSTYELTAKGITSPDNVSSLAIVNFQQESMRLAQEAIDRYTIDERDIRTLTLGVSKNSRSEIQKLLAETRRKIVDIANSDPDADQVYQINFQVFPLSKSPDQEYDT
jgi:uncharacterized protein (TIGR02147 family)